MLSWGDAHRMTRWRTTVSVQPPPAGAGPGTLALWADSNWDDRPWSPGLGAWVNNAEPELREVLAGDIEDVSPHPERLSARWWAHVAASGADRCPVGADLRASAVLGGLRGTSVPGPPPGGQGIVYLYRIGIAWRDLPEDFGPWQTVWKRHRRFSLDGTWDKLLTRLLAEANAAGKIEWSVSVDSAINRAHQHAATLPRHTVGTGELHETARRAG